MRRLDPRAPPALVSGLVLMATFEEVSVSGFEEFDKAVKDHQGKTIFAYFSGSKDAEGKSWCPDCVEGETRTGGCCAAEGAGRRVLLKPESGVVVAEGLGPVDRQKSLSCPLVSRY